MHALSIALVVAAIAGAAETAAAQLTRPEIRAYEARLQSAGTASTAQIRQIDAALKSKDYAAAVRLATVVLEGPDRPDESPQFNQWIRSLAYLGRGRATLELTGNWTAASPDIKKSAGIGNLQAVRMLLDAYAAAKRDRSALGGYQPTIEDAKRAFTIAADLFSRDGLAMLSDGDLAATLPADERVYWRLMSLSGSDDLRPLLAAIEASGAQSVTSALTKFALVGGPFPAVNAHVAGRDLLATLYAERHLRRVLASSLGSRAPRERAGPAPEAPTVIESFRFLNTMAGLTGFADMYLLIEGAPGSRDGNIRSLERPDLLKEIRAGDNIWVSCGGLSHTATVFSADVEKDELLLVDATYEFWQPSHSSCVTSLRHQPFKYGFYLPTLKLSEVAPMIDAVGTYRTAEVIGRAGDISGELIRARAERNVPPPARRRRASRV